MKKVKTEIAACMTVLDSSDGRIVSRFIFPADFVGFQGHFPDRKILPGVCQIQCALSCIEQAKGRSVALREVVLAKYFAPVGPDEEIVCALSDVQDRGEFTCRMVITKGGARAAELKLRVTVAD